MNRLDYSVTMLRNPMNENDPAKAYAYLQSRGSYNIDELADLLVDRGSNYDRGDAYAIIVKLSRYVRDILLDGYTVDLGDLGRFRLTCSSKGAATKRSFTADNITAINVKFKPSSKFDGLLSNVSLHKVPTRKSIQATLEREMDEDGSAAVDVDGD